MKLNCITTGSNNSCYLEEHFINKLQVFPQNINQFTINNIAEQYYNQIDTSLLIDDYSYLYIRFLKPNMITSDEELEFYKMIGFIPLTKKYFYKYNSFSNYQQIDDYVTIDLLIDVHDYIYSKQLVKNYLSNVHIYNSSQIDTLPFNSTIQIKVHFKKLNIDATTLPTIISDLIIKMNCVLFDDIIIYEKLKTNQSLNFFIYTNIYSPITFKYNNLLYSENDKISIPYKTSVLKNDSTEYIEFDTIFTNQILYKDMVYFLNFKGGSLNSFNFINYSNLLAANVKGTDVNDSIYNTLSNKNYILLKFFYESFNIVNSLKFRSIFKSEYGNILNLENWLTDVLNLNYNTNTINNTIQLLQKDKFGNEIPVKEFIFYDKESKYKSIMTTYYNGESNIFLQNTIPTTVIQINPSTLQNSNDDFLPIDVSLNTYIVFNNEHTDNYGIIKDLNNNTTSCLLRKSAPYITMKSKLNNTYTSYPEQFPYRQDITISLNDIAIPYDSTFYGNEVYNQDDDIAGLLGGYQRFIQYRSMTYYTYEYILDTGQGFHLPKLTTSTLINTNLTNDMDEFTLSFIFKYNNGLIKIGDFITINDNILYLFNNNVGNFNSAISNIKYYPLYDSKGEPDNNRILPHEQTILCTFRYYYGEVTVDFVNITLNPEFVYDYDTKRYNFTYNLNDHHEINVSNIKISILAGSYNPPAFCIGDIDIKSRYVEDFLLYDFKNGLRESGNGMVLRLY